MWHPLCWSGVAYRYPRFVRAFFGRGGSLTLSRTTLSFATPCRFCPAVSLTRFLVRRSPPQPQWGEPRLALLRNSHSSPAATIADASECLAVVAQRLALLHDPLTLIDTLRFQAHNTRIVDQEIGD